MACDVAQADAVRAAFARLPAGLRLGVVVHAAAVNVDGLLVRARDADLRAMLDTNLLGALHVSRAAVRSMLRPGGPAGCIVHIGSVVGQCGSAGQTAYAASKSGLLGLTRSLAKEVATAGIRVNLVVPGFVDAGMTESLPATRRDALRARIPLGRFGSIDDVVQAVRFCIFHAPYMTGQALTVDGGLCLVS